MYSKILVDYWKVGTEQEDNCHNNRKKQLLYKKSDAILAENEPSADIVGGWTWIC